MRTHERPESEWDHAHALEGDETLVFTDTGDRFDVDVHDDGSVTVTHRTDGRQETYTEAEINDALADGLFETEDGLGHELATF